MLEGICDGLIFLWDTYITSYEGIATVVIILIMLLKVLINQKASTLHFKKMIVSFPGEIVFLVMGFLLADIISISKVKHNENDIMAGIIIAFIILVIQYALERWLDDKLIGKLKLGILIIIIGMYVLSIAFYIFIIFGGVYNG